MQADPKHRWARPGQQIVYWRTLEEALGSIQSTATEMESAILSVLMQSQQEAVLRAFGWTERVIPIPPKLEA